MARGQLGGVLRQLCRAALDRGGPDPTDAELLDRFVARRDAAAFEAIVRRHGPMVFGVCRRILLNEADAEDAFQATFLVLVRKAPSVRPRSQLGNWLYGVAHNTALKAKAMSRKRRAKERESASARPGPADERWARLQELLDEELSRLPHKYRVPIVLCDLQGQPLKEAALHLGWPQGTVASRLSRGRNLLARRLSRRGLAVSGGGLGVLLAQTAASAGVPPALVNSTLEVVPRLAASLQVAALAEGVVKAMFLTKLKVVTAVLVVVAAAGVGVGGLSEPTRAAEPDAGHMFSFFGGPQNPGTPDDGIDADLRRIEAAHKKVQAAKDIKALTDALNELEGAVAKTKRWRDWKPQRAAEPKSLPTGGTTGMSNLPKGGGLTGGMLGSHLGMTGGNFGFSGTLPGGGLGITGGLTGMGGLSGGFAGISGGFIGMPPGGLGGNPPKRSAPKKIDLNKFDDLEKGSTTLTGELKAVEKKDKDTLIVTIARPIFVAAVPAGPDGKLPDAKHLKPEGLKAVLVDQKVRIARNVYRIDDLKVGMTVRLRVKGPLLSPADVGEAVEVSHADGGRK